jgi:DNA (cytosine-5)-methyltransferase 1
MASQPIPVVDLFAGPGGLGEGFSRVGGPRSFNKVFKTVISIEKDPTAVETLRLRVFYRAWSAKRSKLPNAYLVLVRAQSLEQKEAAIKKLNAFEEWKHAKKEVPRGVELGRDTKFIIETIKEKLGEGLGKWVLIGGPPCQAYSLVGRSRMRNHDGKKKDPRHYLYREYLKVVRVLRPAVFVMENVKGLNTAKVDGKKILPKIEKDLRRKISRTEKVGDVSYQLHSLALCESPPKKRSMKSIGVKKMPTDYLLRAEDYGVPQTRHRVIILGVRSDIKVVPGALKKAAEPVSLLQVIGGLPGLIGLDSDRPRSEYADSQKGAPCVYVGEDCDLRNGVPSKLTKFISPIKSELNTLLLNHEARSHMQSDLERYKWWAENSGEKSPTVDSEIFPKHLLPKHANLSGKKKSAVFVDRFKVQVPQKPCGTITSHISKDGHYYIHYDPAQARSFSVREAARVQTFPDDYFFMGNRTQQYHQVGNAVPPYLAYQIGQIVAGVLGIKVRG